MGLGYVSSIPIPTPPGTLYLLGLRYPPLRVGVIFLLLHKEVSPPAGGPPY